MQSTVSEVIINDGASANLGRIESALDKVTAAEVKTTRATDAAARSFEGIARIADPVYGTLGKLADQHARLQRAVDLGVKSQGEANQVYGQLHSQASMTIQKLGGISSATNDNTKAFALNRAGLLELQAAGVNSFQALASGMGPLRVATMEGAQAIGAFAQGGLGFTGILKGMLSPIGLVVAGTATLAVGVAAVGLRMAENAGQLRAFDVILTGMGTRALTTAANLQQVARQLRDTGTSNADAQAAAQSFARIGGISPGSASTLLPLSRDIAASRGDDFAKIAADLGKAFATSTEAAIKLVYEMAGPNGLTVAQAATARAMDLAGNRAGAAGVLIGVLQARYSGLHHEALTPTENAVNELTGAWNRLLDRMSETSAFKKAQDALLGLLKSATDAVNGSPAAALRLLGVAGALPIPGIQQVGAVAGVASAAAGYLSSGGSAPSAYPATAGLPGASNSFDTRGLETNTESLQRLSTVMDAAVKHLPEGYALVATSTVASRASGTANHPAGNAMDVQLIGPSGPIPNEGADSTGLYRQLAGFAYLENQRLFPGSPLAWGGRFGTVPGGNVPDLMHFDTGADRGRFAPPLATIAAGLQPTTGFPGRTDAQIGALVGDTGVVSNAVSQESLDNLGKAQKAFDQVSAAARKFGDDNLYAKTYAEALASSSKTGNERIWESEQKASQAVELHRIELGKTAATQTLANDLALRTAQAVGTDEVAGYKAAALAQATLAARQGDAIDVQSKFNELLRTGAVEAIGAAAKALPGLNQQTAATQRLAEAARLGAGAAHEAELQNQATAATHDALTKAITTGDPALVSRAQKLRDMTLEQVKANDAASFAKQIQDSINQRTDQVAVAQVQIGMAGQPSEVIAAATAHLQEEQRLRALNVDLASDRAKADLASVDALSKVNIQLADSNREAQRWNDAIRSAAESVDTSLTTAIENAFDKSKVTDWATTITNTLRSIGSQLVSGLFIRPLTGSILQAFGATPIGDTPGGFGAVTEEPL